MNSRDFQSRLARRARRAGLALPAQLSEQLEAYYRLLAIWNAKINLTGLKLADAPPEAVDRLLIEPVVAAKHVPVGTNRMLDIGTGGGSPAIPLALASACSGLSMVESKTRKSVFLREVVRTLGLSGADVITARFEELLARPDLHEAFDMVSVRAVRVESRLLVTLQAFVRPGGVVLLFRGPGTSGQSETVTPPLAWQATYPLIESLRSRLVVLTKRQEVRTVPRGTVPT
ncbi:MAG: 16S rRNA (guanine(527)-N(7))-methyltransferase RsmG [Acidobacteria bacterium]|nr:16S rRNA (guanine(527)-N(7))-methyltransferase RsmG [Acidobacteriota bacterium]